MDKSLGSTIEKIKREEQNKEAKLKARRELEAARSATERSIRDVVAHVKKMQQDKSESLKKTDDLRAQVTIQKIRRDALAAQLSASNIELEVLRTKYNLLTSEVQELRSNYCKTVQDVSDDCDVWALLTKPSTEPLLPQTAIKKPTGNEMKEKSFINERRLKEATERREKALMERERLKSEPDKGEEFVRIKNALGYSLEMTANLRK